MAARPMIAASRVGSLKTWGEVNTPLRKIWRHHEIPQLSVSPDTCSDRVVAFNFTRQRLQQFHHPRQLRLYYPWNGIPPKRFDAAY